MNELVYPRERFLGTLTLILGILVWGGLVIGTFGVALIALLVGFVVYLFAQSALIAYIKGNGIELSENQFPDIYAQFTYCCDLLKFNEYPKAYVLNGNGSLNAFATRFLGAHFVVLFSDVVDAMAAHDDGVKFYIGHELGHIRMKHLSGLMLRWPVLWLPLIGAAYSRARETTCDRHGLACCKTPQGAGRALAALSAGAERWKNIDIPAYLRQNQQTSSFWMSFHELISGYPWVTKRVARVVSPEAKEPPRNAFAYLFAAFLPYSGRMGSGFGLVILIYIVVSISAVAIPQFSSYQVKAHTTSVMHETQSVRDAMAAYYSATEEIPTLEDIAAPEVLSDGSSLAVDSSNMTLTVSLEEGDLLFVPSKDDEGHILWECAPGEGLLPNQVPAYCP
ncbi:M48 family metallopeptidase [Desulfoluna spongiiphila]|uniref:Zn-dependent protease with chaperone function n=1 Tax=Desulfoluna spongiiphila TaxID=419481 RepID=A0A1G5DWD3_9BACT|nr:M48 family metallopeptidase [Desulfoluna spongiiphila]SCY19024.1 Zn-dependent protease with chaperone function [Desulfoluna spongiiphila]